MIRDKVLLEQFERSLIKGESPNYQNNLKIFEAMLIESLYLRVLPLKNPLEGIEIDIEIARVINSV